MSVAIAIMTLNNWKDAHPIPKLNYDNSNVHIATF